MFAHNSLFTTDPKLFDWKHEYRSSSILIVLATLMVALLAGCGQGGASQNQNSKEVPSPTATTGGATPNATLATSLTMFPVPTEVPGLQETQVARATASPYPTAMPATIKTGSPAAAITNRGDIAIDLRLAGDSYLAGENGRGQITMSNNSNETIFGGDIVLMVTDEQGQQLEFWPIGQTARGGWPGQYGPPGMQVPLQPGGTISRTLTFQVPAWEQSKGHSYKVTALSSFSHPAIQHPDRSDYVPIAIETGPIMLQVSESQPEQKLQAELQADRNGYTLSVTDANGQPINGVIWGAVTVAAYNSTSSGSLGDSASSGWTYKWDLMMLETGAPLEMSGWVAARGYLPATISETIPAAPGYATPDPNAPFPTVVPLVTPVPTSTTPLTGADNSGQTLEDFRNRVLGTPQAEPTPRAQ